VRLAALACWLALHAGQAANAAEMGRLFHTPEQRKALDAARAASSAPKPVIATPDPRPQPVRLEGYVVRSDGRSSVWIDGRVVRVPPKQK